MASIFKFKQEFQAYIDKLSKSTRAMNDTVQEMHDMGDMNFEEYQQAHHNLAICLGKLETCLDIYEMVQKNIQE